MRPRVALRTSDGQALIIAIIVMAALTIGIVAVTQMASSQQGASDRDQAAQQALMLADDGVSNALSVLSNTANPLDAAALPATSAPDGGGTSAYVGTLSGTTWTITGTGTLPSPIAGAGPLTRTSTLEVAVSTANSPWQYLFADSAKGCLKLNNNAQVTTPLYTRGNLCLSNNARVTGSPVAVDGTVKIKNRASIGMPTIPVASATLGGCVFGGGGAHACSAADHVYASSLVQGTTHLVKPPVDLAGVYASAMPGPAHPCTSGSVPGGFDNDTTMNARRPAFNPMSGASYDCQYWENGAMTGRLAWDAASHTLTVQGTVLVDGNLNLSGSASYAGRGTLYATGQVAASKNTRLCGTPACDATWDPTTNLLVLVSGKGIKFKNNSVYQGAMYAVTDFSANNNVVIWGPVIARQMKISNNARMVGTPVGPVPPGAPGAGGTLQIVGGTWRGH